MQVLLKAGLFILYVLVFIPYGLCRQLFLRPAQDAASYRQVSKKRSAAHMEKMY